MAETLKRAGIDVTVYEKAGEVGGTWRDNTFPGLFVDVLSRQYEFPFQPNYDWSRKYAPATAIWAYIKKVARDPGLTKFIRFNQEVVAARFTEDGWHIETAKGHADVGELTLQTTRRPDFPRVALPASTHCPVQFAVSRARNTANCRPHRMPRRDGGAGAVSARTARWPSFRRGGREWEQGSLIGPG